MTTNVGKYDQLFRIVLGVIILGAGLYYKSFWGLVGLLPLATAYMRWCPAYFPFRFSTKSKKET